MQLLPSQEKEAILNYLAQRQRGGSRVTTLDQIVAGTLPTVSGFLNGLVAGFLSAQDAAHRKGRFKEHLEALVAEGRLTEVAGGGYSLPETPTSDRS